MIGIHDHISACARTNVQRDVPPPTSFARVEFNVLFLFPTAVPVGFQSVGLGVMFDFCRSEKMERNRNAETLEVWNIVLVCKVGVIVYSLHLFPHPFDSDMLCMFLIF